jgi:hypothetical protein
MGRGRGKWKGRKKREKVRKRRVKEKKRTLRGSPSTDLALEVNTDPLGALELPRKVGDNVDSVRSSDTDSDHTETSSVGGVRVGTDHETTGEGVVLEDDLNEGEKRSGEKGEKSVSTRSSFRKRKGLEEGAPGG